MDHNELQSQLQALVQTLAKAIMLLYSIYTPYFKAFGLLIISYLFFKLGRTSVADPLQQDVKKARTIVQNRAQYTIVLPQKIKSISRSKKISFGLLMIAGVGVAGAQILQQKIIETVGIEWLAISGGAVFVLFLGLWMYEAILNFKMKRGSFNDHHINEKINQINKLLGKKAEGLLKVFLCRDLLVGKKLPTYGVCSKDKCRDYRKLQKQRTDGIQMMVGTTLNFDWCSTCKRKLPFDEYLPFQANQFVKKEQISEEEDATDRNNYLTGQVQRMIKWVKDIGPCNCSKLYWSYSTKEIVQFKARQKQIDKRLKLIEESIAPRMKM